MIRNLAKLVLLPTLKQVYYACFCSHMSYAILCWGGSSHATDVFRVQRRCVRAMTGLGYRDCCKYKFVDLHLLTFPCCYILACLLHVRDYIHEYKKLSDNHDYNTRNKGDILIKYSRIQKARDGINYHGVRFFNKLPDAVQTLNIATFKRIIKDYLTSKAFYSCDEFIQNDFGDLSQLVGSVVS